MIAPDMRIDVWKRDGGNCAVCGLPAPDNAHIHHRKPRGMGGRRISLDRLSNLILIHPSCHLQHVEMKRRRAIENGWLIIGSDDPSVVPLMYMLNGWVLLTDSGEAIEVVPTGREEQE